MKRLSVIIVACVLLLVPVAVMAQDKIVELVFNTDGSKFTVKDTINSMASVTVELNGTQYVVNVPVQINVDATVPLSGSVTTVEDGKRVGQYAIKITSNQESNEDIGVLMPTPFGKNEEKEFQPSEGKKIAVVRFEVANVGSEPLTLYTHQIKGIDDSGRLFEEKDSACMETNPGTSTQCVIVFEIEQDNHIAALDVDVTDHQQLAVPAAE